MQQVITSTGTGFEFLDLPDPEDLVVPGIRWGRHEHPLTPAFWAAAAWMNGDVPETGFRIGGTLAEEVCACLLGGYGIPAEVGLAAFYRIREMMRDSARETVAETAVLRALSEPLVVGERSIRYRFAKQKSEYVSAALNDIRKINESEYDDVALRNRLQEIRGIGPKTASWIVRNRRGSDSVAILDVHVVRACRIMGVFPETETPTHRYFQLEDRFLVFCERLRARASVMDAVMWDTMRRISTNFLSFLVDPRSAFG